MKKFLIALPVLAIGATSTQARVAYERAKASDDVCLGVEGGVAAPLDFSRVTPLDAAADLKLGKQFNPIYGANLEGLTLFGDNRWQTSSLGFSNSHIIVRTINLSSNGTINFTNLFCEYNPGRRFEVGTEADIDYWITYGDKYIIQTNNTSDDTELTVGTGLTFAYNLGGKGVQQFYVEPAILWGLTHGLGGAIQFGKHAAQLGLFVDLDYKFKTSNDTHNFKAWNAGQLNGEINSLRDQLNTKPKEVVREVVEEVVKEVPVRTTQTLRIDDLVFVMFAQGKYFLTNEAKKALDDARTGRRIQIVGTASPEGPRALNDRLSQNRADIVVKYFQSRGVIVDEAKGQGMQDVASNRLAVVYVK